MNKDLQPFWNITQNHLLLYSVNESVVDKEVKSLPQELELPSLSSHGTLDWIITRAPEVSLQERCGTFTVKKKNQAYSQKYDEDDRESNWT